MSALSALSQPGLEVSLPTNPPFTAPLGSYVSVVGRSGAGKSTLCQLIAGLLEDECERQVRLWGRELSAIPLATRSSLISYVPSDPYLSFSGLKGTLRGELDMILRFAGDPDGGAAMGVEEVAQAFGLTTLLDRDPVSLSGGEAARASLAMALAKRPKLLVLDQMTDHLDSTSAADIKQQIQAVLPPEAVVVETLSRACTVQHPDTVSDREADGWRIQIRPLEEALNDATPDKSAAVAADLRARETASDTRPLLQVEGLCFRYSRKGFGLGPMDLALSPGERLALIGRNGSGKTTLLKCLALLQRPDFDRFEIVGTDRIVTMPPPDRKEHRWAKMALYCFQRPEDQLYLSTVRRELEDTANRLAGIEGVDRALELAARLGLDRYLEQSPYDLPRAYRRLIPLAAALAVRPPLLLLDEPTVGLDDEQVSILRELITTEAPNSAIVFISHDAGFINSTATRILNMEEIPTYQGEVANPAFAPK